MYRILTLAAVAAASIAASAQAESIHISTSGKTAEQVQAEVHKAAAHACRAELTGSVIGGEMMSACVRGTVRATLAQTNQASHAQLAAR